MSEIAFTKIEDGRFCGILAVKIVSFPSFKILGKDSNDISEVFFNSFNSILKQIHTFCNDETISAEILWTTKPTTNQINLSDIEIYIIFRKIDFEKQTISWQLNQAYEIFKNTLISLKFEWEIFEDISSLYGSLAARSIFLILKKEEIVNFSNAMLGFFYNYDKIEKDASAAATSVTRGGGSFVCADGSASPG